MFINSTVSSNHKLPLSCKSGIPQLHIRTHGIGLHNCSYVPPLHTHKYNHKHTHNHRHINTDTHNHRHRNTQTPTQTHILTDTNTQIHTHPDTTTAGDGRGVGAKAVDLKDTRGTDTRVGPSLICKAKKGHRAKGPPGGPGFGH